MLIHELTLRGLLSFGPDTPPLKMQALNVLIGPNGSGKSNLIEAIGLLRAAASNLASPVREPGSGGVSEWIWKGSPSGTAHLGAVVDYPRGHLPIRHLLEFREIAQRFELVDESIEETTSRAGSDHPVSFYHIRNGTPVFRAPDGRPYSPPPGTGRSPRPRFVVGGLSRDESILSQRKDPDRYPELAYLAGEYEAFRIYREWSFGRGSVLRTPQSADLPSDALEEDFSNLGLFLNHLDGMQAAKKAVVQHLSHLYEGLENYYVGVRGGTVEVFMIEGGHKIPASRLSDGTLRYLCLLAILCDPTPPPLICIEEPELGLHPDMLPQLADLMIEASERTQLVVTTHSDVFVDAFTERPECVVVVEKHGGQTTMRRLDAADLKDWLTKYRLGQLWTRGEIGGTRW
jgi:predicted ATPase